MQSKIKGKYDSILKKYFGYDSLKKEQFEIIYKLLNDGEDVCAILATGYGKSICYQLPFLITKKSVIVISPLLSLMNDQKMEMQKLKIPVCCFNSDCKMGDKIKYTTDILNGNHKLIYMTPEYLINCEDFIKQLYEHDGIALVCIDEAHCTSTWGNDFRESYSKLNVIKRWIPNVPMLALTATASGKVREDICKSLELNCPAMVIGQFDRPNLYIKISIKKDDVKSDLSDLLNKFKNEYIIIYCKTREDTEQTAEAINELGITSSPYHAGLSNIERDTIQKNFNNGQYKCIVATIAFGMGINVPNIRLVIHYSCPKNLESYYQEIGRAGRDGKYSECHLFYSTKDFILNRYFIKDLTNVKYREYQEQEIRNIEKYVYTTECRRRILLGNFGDIVNECTNCDNCNNKNKLMLEKKDLTLQSCKILSLVRLLNGKFGTGTFVNILRGSSAKNMRYHKHLEAFGNGKEYSSDFWKALIRILINNEYLKEVQIAKRFGSTIECTKKGTEWLGKINRYDPLPLNRVPINGIDKLIFTVTDEIKTELDKISSKTKINVIKIDFRNSKWTAEQEQQLLGDLASGKKIKNIAVDLGRTSGAIIARLKHIACNLYEGNVPLEEISKATKLGSHKILEEVKKKDNKFNNEKQINSNDDEIDNDLFDELSGKPEPKIKKIIVRGKNTREHINKNG